MAAAVELIHCASLVHDDLPCFDDAAVRRGQPTVHRRFGEATAVLVGDALIGLAFEVVSLAALPSPDGLRDVVGLLARGVGAAHGITGGQGWELERRAELSRYHQMKTAALFEVATVGGALAAGAAGEPWRPTGRLLGEAYQLADDLADIFGTAEQLGKAPSQDLDGHALNSARLRGVEATLDRLDTCIERAKSTIPPCHDPDSLGALIDEVARRLVPAHFRDPRGSASQHPHAIDQGEPL